MVSPVMGQSWRLDKDSDNIRVYTRLVHGSDFREFKAEMQVEATLDQIEKILDDHEHYTLWQANMDSASLVNWVGNDVKLLYFQADMPWPITNRDFVFEQTKKKDDNTLIYSNSSKHSELHQNSGFIRVKSADGFWKFTQNGTRVDVLYQWKGDPEGAIPAWVVNIFIVDGPHKTLLNLKEKLENL